MSARLRNGSKTFHVGEEAIVALDRINLDVEPGELTCIYGASGSGKTTLMNVLSGIETPDAGEVVVADRPLHGTSESHRADIRLNNIAVIFQANNLLPEFTARENVALLLRMRGAANTEANASAEQALERLGLVGIGDRLPQQLSGGQRQRVGIARALAADQRVLLADEPTGALDSENSRLLFGLLRGLCDQRDVTVVLATHDPLAREVADTVHHMVDGTMTSQP